AHVAFTDAVYGLTRWLQDRTPVLDRLTRSYHLDERVELPPDAAERMLDVEAAVGLAQLEKYAHVVERRRAHAAFSASRLASTSQRVLPPLVDGATYSHYVVRVADRAACIARMAKQGVQLGELIQYSVPEMPAYRGGRPAPQSSLAARCTV